MKHGRLVKEAFVSHSNPDGHLIGSGVLAAVELDLGFEPLVH